jgi:hypothetical protein
MKKLMVLAVMVAVIFCLVSETAFARGGGHGGIQNLGRGGGGYHGGGGGHFWGGVVIGSIAGAIVAPMFYPQTYVPVYTPPVCSNRIVRPGYFAFDYYGNRMWIRAEVVRECY